MTRPRTERGLDRLIAFTDAAVAIALTLLILPLVDAASEIEEQSLATVLGDNLSLLVGFIISFVVIGRLWYSHHQVFEGVGGYDGTLLWLTLFWLLGIVFFPFGANVLAHSGADPDPGVYGLYVGTMLFTSLFLLAIQVHLDRHPELLRTGADDVVDVTGSAIFSASLALAMVIAMTVSVIGLFSLLLLFVQGPVSTLVARRSGDRPPTDGSGGPDGGGGGGGGGGPSGT